MGKRLLLAGFYITRAEWESLGADDRSSILSAFGGAGLVPPQKDHDPPAAQSGERVEAAAVAG